MINRMNWKSLGRLKQGMMNKSEERYEREILKPGLLAGEILWYKFEAIKLRIAKNTFLTPDFAVLPRSMVMELRDVKGARGIYMDDAKVKMKVAAESYPFVFKVCFVPKKIGYAWEEEII